MSLKLFKKAADFLGDRHMALPVMRLKDPHYFVDLLPYRAFDKENKIYINADSYGWIMELPPLIGGNDELVKILSSVFARVLPEGSYLQVIHWTDPHTQPIFDFWAEPRLKKSAIFKKIARKRCDYFKESGWRSLFPDAPFITRCCRVILACGFPGDPKFEKIEQLCSAREAIKAAFKSLAVAPDDVEPEEFINLLYRLIWPNPEQLPPRLTYSPTDPLHEQLIEPEAHLSVTSGSIAWSSGVAASVLDVLGFPEFWPQWRNPDLMGQEFNDLMRPICPVLTCLSFEVRNKATASDRIFMKSAKATRRADSDLRRFWPDIIKQEAELKVARKYLENGQALVQAGIRVAVMAPTAHVDLENAIQAVRSLYDSQGFRLGLEASHSLSAFLSMLPLFGAGSIGNERRVRGVGRAKSMMTWSCANLAPIQGDWRGRVGDHPPGLLLFSRRGEPSLWNPFDAKTGNFNVAIAGKSGSGKSVLMQELVAAMVGSNAHVLVIDDGRSFEHSCKVLGGQFVEFSTTSDICLNPFSAVDAKILKQDSDYREATLNLIVDMVSQACRPTEGVGDYDRGIITKAVVEAWESKKSKATFTTVRDQLLKVKDSRADDLAQIMADYCKGGLSARFFEGKCTLRLDSQLMVFELGELKTRKNLQALVLMLIVFLGTQRMFRSPRDQATAIIIDEAWDLLSSNSSGDFINGVARRARKHKGALITGTQSVDDYYATPAARAAFDNAETYLLLSQNRESINFLKKEERIDCDDSMEAALKSLRKIDNQYSEFLMIDDGGYRLLRLVLDPFSTALYSSKGEDWSQIKKHMAQGKSIHQAIDLVAESITREAA